jgi:hypothetical protein
LMSCLIPLINMFKFVSNFVRLSNLYKNMKTFSRSIASYCNFLLTFFTCSSMLIVICLCMFVFSVSKKFWLDIILLLKKIFSSPRASDPTGRSDRFRSDPCRISSESDIFHKKPIGSDTVFVGFDRNIQIRQDPIPPLWPGYFKM